MPFPKMNPALERALVARAYDEPTAVQLAVLEPAAIGHDMLVSAQTGSGKTVAFGLTLAPKLLGDAERFGPATAPMALIITPTRELAVQVQRELAWLYAETGARFASCVGGMDVRTEKTALAAGAHIVVGTPGRLRDHLERRRLDVTKLAAVVLDEADEMLDLGFREDLEFILDATPAERQTLMFSATVPRPIEALARKFQRDAVRIETVGRNLPHEDIEYRAVRTLPHAVESTVINLLRYYDSKATLVFCATREGVRRMHTGLANRGFAAVALSGELSQAERTLALQSLRDGRAKVLVATDVAARGLDLPELALVIHADLPNDPETLLHRLGRTGRAGRKGISVLVIPPSRRRKAEQLLGIARVNAEWEGAPTAKQIAAKDQERLLALPILDELATAEDLALGRTLLEGRTPEQLAAALIRMHRASLPVPEDIRDTGRGAAPSRHERPERSERANSHDRDEGRGRTGFVNKSMRDPAAAGGGFNRSEREGRDEMVWFGLNIGREKNADPRWLLPLICRVGDVSKSEIGSIKIADRQTTFEILASHADQFELAFKASKNKEGKMWRVDGEAAPAASEPKSESKPGRPHVSKPYKPKRPIVDAAETGEPAVTLVEATFAAETTAELASVELPAHDTPAPVAVVAEHLVAERAVTQSATADVAAPSNAIEPSVPEVISTGVEHQVSAMIEPLTEVAAEPSIDTPAKPKKPRHAKTFDAESRKPRDDKRGGSEARTKPAWQKRPDGADAGAKSGYRSAGANGHKPYADASARPPPRAEHSEARSSGYQARPDRDRDGASSSEGASSKPASKPWQKRSDATPGAARPGGWTKKPHSADNKFKSEGFKSRSGDGGNSRSEHMRDGDARPANGNSQAHGGYDASKRRYERPDAAPGGGEKRFHPLDQAGTAPRKRFNEARTDAGNGSGAGSGAGGQSARADKPHGNGYSAAPHAGRPEQRSEQRSERRPEHRPDHKRSTDGAGGAKQRYARPEGGHGAGAKPYGSPAKSESRQPFDKDSRPHSSKPHSAKPHGGKPHGGKPGGGKPFSGKPGGRPFKSGFKAKNRP